MVTYMTNANFSHKDKINRLNDLLFKRVFGSKGHEKLLVSLLNSIFASYNEPNQIVVKSLTLMDRELDPLSQHYKRCLLDLRARLDNEAIVNIEVQVRPTSFMPRSLYYAALSMVLSLPEGEDYTNIPHIIMINLLDYIDRHDNDDWINSYTVVNKRTLQRAPKAFDLYNIEMPRWREAYAAGKFGNNKLYKWFVLLTQSDDKLILDWAKNDPELENYIKMEQAFFNSDEFLLYLQREREIKDAKAARKEALQEGMEKGFEQGIKQGIEQGIEKLIINMLRHGYSAAQISAMTDVSEDLVRRLQTGLS